MAHYEKIEWKDYESGASDNTPINAENLGKMDKGVYAAIKKDIGMVAFFCSGTAPDGWKVCNGDELLISEFEDLHDVIGNTFNVSSTPNTKFKLPDLQGMFIRGLNTTNSGIDKNRTLGSIQESTKVGDAGGSLTYMGDADDYGTTQWDSCGNDSTRTVHKYGIRPDNIALLPCIFTGVFETDLS